MYYKNAPDETLVMLTLAGEQTAYEILVTRYQRIVISSAMSVAKNYFMAEDAAQDAFVTAWMKLNTLQEPQKYGSWVSRIAKNCALNMISRYRSFLPIDVADNLSICGDKSQDPEEVYVLSDERDEVNKSIETLPGKVKQIIYLHYFEDLSIAEIADRMRISEGTVKWQLHDGRKRIRKELCAMNEKYSDNVVQRVMKKVEELKMWQTKNDKSGFEKIYGEVLREVEDLPECREKQHALADVLMRGWWWIPGKKNDALFARIAEAANEGKNEDVMAFIVAREDSKVYEEARMEFIRDKQIPRLEKAGFVKTLGREWFWLGYYLFRDGKTEEGNAAYRKAEKILQKDDAYRVLIPYAKAMEEQLATRYKNVAETLYSVGGYAEEYRMIDGKLLYWSQEYFGEGYLVSINRMAVRIFRNASSCDGCFFADISLGETYTGSDGTKLSYISDNETVDTPAGRFENCRLWEVRRWTEIEKIVCRSYYKDGVGIVRQEHITDGLKETRTLKSYDLKGGNGLLPLFPGNTWEYVSDYPADVIASELKITVSYADGNRIVLSGWENSERLKYDEKSCSDMLQKIASDYCRYRKNGTPYICDIYSVIERAEKLAVTPMEKAHAKAAASAARRILSTDTEFNPDFTAVGCWNFFGKEYIHKKNDSLCLTGYNSRWSFEWKRLENTSFAGTPVLYNDILGILQDATNCIWSDEWRVGASPIAEYTKWQRDVKTQIVCEDGGTVTTKAGTFENCLKLCLDISGMSGGIDYRGGNKVYYFAEGIGIVRTENKYCDGARTAVYELTSYNGVGEGFMPVSDGLVRRYDAIDLTDGFVGAVEYTYVADEDGDIVVFGDRTGVREVVSPITQYNAIQGEVIESRLWNTGKHRESRLCHDVNNFHIMCHFLGRPSRYWRKPEKAVSWNKYRLKTIEGFGDGVVPDAWLCLYASTSFRTASALFGCGKKEEGYEFLDKAFEIYNKWNNIPDGTEMEVGDSLIYGGIKVIKGKNLIKIPDGTIEPITYTDLFKQSCGILYYGMTAPHGWEWFNSVRGDERFKEYIERAKNMTGKA